MIQDIQKKAISLGIDIVLYWDKVLKTSLLKLASFKVGYVGEDNKADYSHLESIKTHFLPPRGLEIVGIIDALLRELWDIMKDPNQYYDRSDEQSGE